MRGYVDTSTGQLHYHRWGNGERVLVCLPPVPYSGVYFEPLANALSGYTVICPDPPGYGASDPLPQPPTIEAFAQAVVQVLQSQNVQRCDVLGFHTGTLVSMALAAQTQVTVERVQLIDAPAFSPEKQQELLTGTDEAREFGLEPDSIENIWHFNVRRHGDNLPRLRGVRLFVDDMISGAGQPLGFRAAFGCDIPALVAAVPDSCSVRIVATAAALLEPTRHLHALFLDQASGGSVEYTEWPEAKSMVFDNHLPEVTAWLS